MFETEIIIKNTVQPGISGKLLVNN